LKVKQVLTRRLLSKKKNASVKGYFLIYLEGFNYILDNINTEKTTELFVSSCLGVTLPDTSLKTAVFTGRQGWNREVPVSHSKGHDLNLTFITTQDGQLINIINQWYVKLINFFSYAGTNKSNQYKTNIYGSKFWYWEYLPNMIEVTYGFHGEGFFPTKKLTNEFNNTIGSNEVRQISVPFHIDYYKEYYGGTINKDIKEKGLSISKRFFSKEIEL